MARRRKQELADIISEIWRNGNKMPKNNQPVKTRATATQPSAPVALVFANGSVLSSAVPVSSLREQHAHLCVYGRNRSGKTTLAAQFPKPLLVVSCERVRNGGADSITNVPGVIYTRAAVELLPGDVYRGTEKVLMIGRELGARNPFKTVVLDTATSLQDIAGAEVTGTSDLPEMLHKGSMSKAQYEERAHKLRAAIGGLLDLECHVVVLAQEKDHNPVKDDFGGKAKLLRTMQQGSFMAPALGATSAEWLESSCGYIVQLYEDELTEDIVIPQMGAHGEVVAPVTQRVGTGKRQRHLRLLYHPNFAAGGRWQYTPGMPEFVTSPTPEGLYGALASHIPSLRS